MVLFKNPTNEDFTYSWNKIPHTIPAQESTWMELWRAEHAAKHLIDRELNKQNLNTSLEEKRDELRNQIIVEEAPISSAMAEVEVANKNIEKKKKKTKSTEEVFEGLNE